MTAQDTAVHVTRVIPGSPERVFAAWTEAGIFARWFAPHGYDVTEIDIDPRVGGRYRVTVTGPDGDRHTTSGVYTEVSPPHRLAMSWTYAGDHPDAQRDETHLVVECHPHVDGTEVRLLHTQLRTDRARANVASGWQGCLDKLATVRSIVDGTDAYTITQRFAASPDRLFRAWTEVKDLETWLATHVEFEARNGGRYRFVTEIDGAEHICFGPIETFVPGRELGLTWYYVGPGVPTPHGVNHVRVTWHDAGDGITEQRFTESGTSLDTEEGRVASAAAWQSIFHLLNDQVTP